MSGNEAVAILRITKLIRLADSFSNKPVTNANISVNVPGVVFIEKGGGFYVTTGILQESTIAEISRRGYKTVFISIADCGETVVLTPEGILEDYKEIKCRLAGAGKKNISVKYGVLNKSSLNMVLGIEGPNLIKMDFSEKGSLIGRQIAFEGINEIYNISEYDFIKKCYRISGECKALPNEGAFAYILNDAQTDERGEFSAFIPRNSIKKQRTVYILLTVGGRQHIKSIKQDETENGEVTLVFGGRH